MDISLFDYELPEQLIAQHPLEKRDNSKLLIFNRTTNSSVHKSFYDVIDYLNPGDALVINNTKVFKARLLGKRKSGADVEILLSKTLKSNLLNWEALGRPSRRLAPSEQIWFGDDNFLTLKESLGEGRWVIEFTSDESKEFIIENYGHVPLPPYITRNDEISDIDRYQTTYADKTKNMAVAAPTAGLHFTKELLDKIKAKKVELIELTLNVGPGTFKPVQCDDIEDHTVDSEVAELSEDAAEKLNRVRNNGGNVIAVGTTSVRTLESAPIENNQILPFSGEVDLYIKPGYNFKNIDHLITNFHLPKSSLLILVSAFAGREQILKLYKEAVEKEYRFYSYGDAMLII